MLKNMQQPSNTARAAANNCHVESVEKESSKTNPSAFVLFFACDIPQNVIHCVPHI